ncbi:decarbamoylnovobiocin carbamoyltransferase [bacterium BMS3Bbin10]|nr:decarbamoylnovobiocin carbamoyltransferase [bacterium BMS3Bbin10]
MRILGISCLSHDAGIAVIKDGVPEIVIEEERLNREKRTLEFPAQSLFEAFDRRGLTLGDVDAITTPWRIHDMRVQMRWMLLRGFPRSFNLLRQNALGVIPRYFVFLDFVLRSGLRKHFDNARVPNIVQCGHHNSHAASFYVSPFDKATVLVMDGYGDNCSTSVYEGAGDKLRFVRKNQLTDSLGILYTFVSQYLGFASFGDEGKVMGLAAYGEPTYVERFRDLVHLRDDGEYALNRDYFCHHLYGQNRPFTRKFQEVFGPPNPFRGELTQRHRDLAFALQAVTEETILHIVRAICKQHDARKLCLVGGVAMNCVANSKILEHTDVEEIWVPPCASDTGVPLGSALWHHHQTLRNPRSFELTHPFYGVGYSDEEIVAALKAAGLTYKRLEEGELLATVAGDLADGKIIGWFQDRFEMGARALGNRSILADPRRAEMKDIINARVKHREPFRPFAPAVLIEHASEYFEIDQADPYMTIAPRVRKEKAKLIPAAVHVDGTGRFQTVERTANPRYYGVIEAFKERTGVPVLLNTSFNRQEPIVARPEEAISCFLRTDMDGLVLGNYYSTDRNPAAVKQAHNAFEKAAAPDVS